MAAMNPIPAPTASARGARRPEDRLSTYLAAAIVEGVLLLVAVTLLFRSHQAASNAEAKLTNTRGQVEQQDRDLAAAKASLATLEDEVRNLTDQLESGHNKLKTLESERETVIKSRDTLEDEMRKALQSKDIAISELQGKLTVNILDRIMFDSGDATIKSEGGPVLKKIADILAPYPHRRILVVGHTDNVPIRPGSKKGFASNWELSTARATAAVRFLVEKAGIDPRRIGAVGYGENQPIADNRTADGRSRNRRISVTVLEDDRLLESPAAKPAAPVNTAPPAPQPDAPTPAKPGTR